MKKCRNCGELNKSNTVFCFQCGSTDLYEVAEKICPECGEANEESNVFCMQCGAPLGDGKQVLSADAAESDMTECPFCHSPISVDTVYCTSCGKDVTEYNSSSRVKKAVCINCGHVNDADAQYCTYCFADLSKSVKADYEVSFLEKESLPDVRIVQAVLENGSEEDAQVICPNCRALNKVGELYCEHCGSILEVETPKKYCFVCGAENNFNASYCTNCQFPFDAAAAAEVPEEANAQPLSGWTCSCGQQNTADALFCVNCGQKKQ